MSSPATSCARRCVGSRLVTPEDGLEHDERTYRRRDVHRSHGEQDCGPSAGRLGDEVADRHEQRGDTLRAIEHAIDAPNVLGAERITRGGTKQTVDLTPGKEDQAAQKDEGPGIAAESGKRGDA